MKEVKTVCPGRDGIFRGILFLEDIPKRIYASDFGKERNFVPDDKTDKNVLTKTRYLDYYK